MNYISPLSRLYVWSVVFEPLLFFILFERSVFGVSGNISKLFQLVVVLGLVLRLLVVLSATKPQEIRIVNITNPLYANFGIYFVLLVFAGLIGLLSGAYDLPASYINDDGQSAFSQVLNSKAVRPIMEYGIALYYFIYFVILPKYLLNSKKSVEYLLSVFRAVFIISFVIGVIDLGLIGLAGIEFVPRHIVDGIHVGTRFHGLMGEPRQAFVYLFMGLAILHLHANYKRQKLSAWWVVLVIIAAAFTKSTSGLLGIVAFIVLYIIYSVISLDVKKIRQMATLSVIGFFTLYLAVINSDRTLTVLASASNIWPTLEAGKTLPYLLAIQADSIYPLYDLTVKFRNAEFFPILIGSGLGSASVINNLYAGVVEGTSNPNAQFVRILFESGLFGLLFYVLAFSQPVKHLTKKLSSKKQHTYMMFMLLVLGCSFGVRSPAPFIYLGILIAVFRVSSRKKTPNNTLEFNTLRNEVRCV